MSYDRDSFTEGPWAAPPPPARPAGLRLFGVGVNIDPSWLIFALFVGSQFWGDFKGVSVSVVLPAVALIVIGLSLSIFLHEMSHTLTGRALGMRIDRITLYMFGGVAELQDEPRKGSAEFLMAIAGPALSVLLWWLLRELTPVLIQARAPGMIVFAVNELSRLNLTLAIFNMIPAFPMDGGRVLRSLIWMVTGRVGLATRIAATLGQVFGGLLMLFGAYEAVFEQAFAGGLWMVVLGLMLIGMAKAGRRAAPRD